MEKLFFAACENFVRLFGVLFVEQIEIRRHSKMMSINCVVRFFLKKSLSLFSLGKIRF